MVGINVALHVSGILDIPVLFIDTEMTEEDHWPRIVAHISKANDGLATINDVEQGSFQDNVLKREKVHDAVTKFGTYPFYYRSVIGKQFEEILPLIRRWLWKTVGFDDNGKLKDCLVIYTT